EHLFDDAVYTGPARPAEPAALGWGSDRDDPGALFDEVVQLDDVRVGQAHAAVGRGAAQLADRLGAVEADRGGAAVQRRPVQRAHAQRVGRARADLRRHVRAPAVRGRVHPGRHVALEADVEL